MEKTRLGVPAELLAAAIFLLGIFDGYTPVVLLAGYILLMEESQWLKKCAAKGLALMLYFSIIIGVIDLLPEFIIFLDNVFSMFGSSFYIEELFSFSAAVRGIISIVKTLLFIGTGLRALERDTIPVSIVDDLVDKCFDKDE